MLLRPQRVPQSTRRKMQPAKPLKPLKMQLASPLKPPKMQPARLLKPPKTLLARLLKPLKTQPKTLQKLQRLPHLLLHRRSNLLPATA